MNTKKILVISGVTVLAGALLYFAYQYRKLMSYVINYKGLTVRNISANNIAFDLFVEFVNNSNLKINLKNQQYKVYVNDKYVSKGGTNKPATIEPNQSSVLTNLVSFNPTDVLKALERNWADILLKPDLIIVRIDYQVNASLFGIGVPIKNTYKISLKQIMDMRKK